MTVAERQETTTKKPAPERLRGYVRQWFPERQYGFISVKSRTDETTGKLKQWHFHLNAVTADHWTGIAKGAAVEFTPKPPRIAGKQDSARDVVVVVVG